MRGTSGPEVSQDAWRARRWRAGIAAIALAATAAVSLALLPADQAEAESTRTLTFKQMHTGETQTITYKRNGRYDKAALKKVNYMLRDWRRNETTQMDPRLLDLIWDVKQATGSTAAVHVLSGYRSPVTNSMLRRRSRGVAKNSQHTLGKALDFYLPDVPLAKLRKTAMRMQRGGVGYYPTSGSPFVHLDVARVRAWPRMTRKQLLALFPDGETLHLPSDGKPLPGYARAKAKAERGQLAVAYSGSGSSRGSSGGGAVTVSGRGGDAASAIVVASSSGASRPARGTATPARQQASAQARAEVTGESWTPPANVPLPRHKPGATTTLASITEEAGQGDEAPLITASIPLPRRRPLVSGGPSDSSSIAGLIARQDDRLTALARSNAQHDLTVDPTASPEARSRLAAALALRASELSSERTIAKLTSSASLFAGGSFSAITHPTRTDAAAMLTLEQPVIQGSFAGPVVVYAQPTGFAGPAVVSVPARHVGFARARGEMDTALLRQ